MTPELSEPQIRTVALEEISAHACFLSRRVNCSLRFHPNVLCTPGSSQGSFRDDVYHNPKGKVQG